MKVPEGLALPATAEDDDLASEDRRVDLTC